MLPPHLTNTEHNGDILCGTWPTIFRSPLMVFLTATADRFSTNGIFCGNHYAIPWYVMNFRKSIGKFHISYKLQSNENSHIFQCERLHCGLKLEVFIQNMLRSMERSMKSIGGLGYLISLTVVVFLVLWLS